MVPALARTPEHRLCLMILEEFREPGDVSVDWQCGQICPAHESEMQIRRHTLFGEMRRHFQRLRNLAEYARFSYFSRACPRCNGYVGVTVWERRARRPFKQ